MVNAVTVSELSKHYDGLVAVDAVSFEVGSAEIFGFLGPNGAGKTTTISMLSTLIKPTSGRASIAGHDVASDPAAVRREIGIVFQDTTLDDRLTARENLAFHGELYGMSRAEISQRVAEILGRVGLFERADDIVLTYSGGMRRRLEVARGLMHWPSVLFLDEATLGLDPQTRRTVWDHIRSLRESEGATIFLSTHYMEEAEACDRIAVIDAGKIIALDSPTALKSKMGGDVVTVAGPDNDALAQEIRQAFELEAKDTGTELEFSVPDGGQFIPILLSRLSGAVESVSIRRPTLDDVFVSLTGHQIRDSGAGEAERRRTDLTRMIGRGFGGRR